MDTADQQADPCLIIVNPAAGGGRAKRAWSKLARDLAAAGVRFETTFTAGPGSATTLCRDALRRGVRRIVAAGGDGTLNEVVNGFFEHSGESDHVPREAVLGIIPLGTGSDFARSFGIRGHSGAIRALREGITTRIDVGVATCSLPDGGQGRRFFVNVADAGLGADTARRVNEGHKLFGSTLSYLVHAVRAIRDGQPGHVSISVDDTPAVEQPASIVVVANMPYFGGGMLVAPQARGDDGMFDLLWIGGATRRRLLLDILPRVYRGKHIGHVAVKMRHATHIRITSQPPLPVEVDGELFGITPATFDVLPGALRVIVPAHL